MVSTCDDTSIVAGVSSNGGGIVGGVSPVGGGTAPGIGSSAMETSVSSSCNGGISSGGDCSAMMVFVSSSNTNLRNDLSNVLRSRSSSCESILFPSFFSGDVWASCRGEEESHPAFALVVLLLCQKKRVVQSPVTPTLVLCVGILTQAGGSGRDRKTLVALRGCFSRLRAGRLVVYDRIASSKRRLVMPLLALRASLVHEPVALARTEVSCRGEDQLLPPWIGSLGSSG